MSLLSPIIPLRDGSAMRITTAKYFTPSGMSIQAKGIEPDIIVEPGVVDQKTTDKHLKEKDLEGHLENEPDKEIEKEETEKVKEMKDLQIKRALEYLKSWHIFQGTSFEKTS